MDYKTLKEINVSKHIEKKGNLSYLSWVYAIDTLMERDEAASWEYGEFQTFPDGTMMIYCTVKAFGKERTAQLPVMDHKNQAVSNPNAFQVNTAMQRCLAKAIALHGIGLYIYAGEDLPQGEKEKNEVTDEQRKIQRDYFYEIAAAEDEYALVGVREALDDTNLPEILKGPLQDAITSHTKMIESGHDRPIPEWGYINVREATLFASQAGKIIDNSVNAKELSEWMVENDHKAKALDKMLTAEKYQANGMSPYQRLVRKYEDKIKQLKEAA